MSRSYRKPIYRDGYGTKRKRLAKRAANRSVRRTSDVANGKAYKRHFETWEIYDYRICQWFPPHIGTHLYIYGHLYEASLAENVAAYRKACRK